MYSKVKWFNNAKGYGFLENSEGDDIFIHYSSILSDGYKTLTQGELVKYDLIRTQKGLQAKNVTQIKATLA